MNPRDYHMKSSWFPPELYVQQQPRGSSTLPLETIDGFFIVLSSSPIGQLICERTLLLIDNGWVITKRTVLQNRPWELGTRATKKREATHPATPWFDGREGCSFLGLKWKQNHFPSSQRALWRSHYRGTHESSVYPLRWASTPTVVHLVGIKHAHPLLVISAAAQTASTFP